MHPGTNLAQELMRVSQVLDYMIQKDNIPGGAGRKRIKRLTRPNMMTPGNADGSPPFINFKPRDLKSHCSRGIQVVPKFTSDIQQTSGSPPGQCSDLCQDAESHFIIR
jgi:hypothetical protein